MALTSAIYNRNVRSKNTIVYVSPFTSDTEDAEEVTLITTVKKTDGEEGTSIIDLTKKQQASGVSFFKKIGELRRDSVVANITEGNSVEGNELGKVIIDKNAEISFSIINVNQEITDELDTIDGTDVCILMVSTDSDGVEEGEFFMDLPFNYNETMTGGEVGSINITLNKSFSNIDDYSILLPVPVVQE